jgi:hypothetical protein
MNGDAISGSAGKRAARTRAVGQRHASRAEDRWSYRPRVRDKTDDDDSNDEA